MATTTSNFSIYYPKVIKDITETTRLYDTEGNLVKEVVKREVVTEERDYTPSTPVYPFNPSPSYPWWITTTNGTDVKFG